MLFHRSETATVRKKFLIKAQCPAHLMDESSTKTSYHFQTFSANLQQASQICPLAAFIIMLRVKKEESEIQLKWPLQVTCKSFMCKLWQVQLRGFTVVHF